MSALAEKETLSVISQLLLPGISNRLQFLENLFRQGHVPSSIRLQGITSLCINEGRRIPSPNRRNAHALQFLAVPPRTIPGLPGEPAGYHCRSLLLRSEAHRK